MTISHRLLLLPFAIILLLSACESPFKQDDIDSISKDLKQSYQDVKKKLDELAPSQEDVKSLTSDEVAKLFNFEYKVVELENTLSAVEIESQLASLGKDRWECFQAVSAGTVTRFFFKRRPETYLRYLPRMFM